ncbi:hypothetical protein B0H13DRAFT_2669811, partial [Mycena leptocephala]
HYSAHPGARTTFEGQLLVPHACTSGGSQRAEYNDVSIARRVSGTTPWELFATPSVTYACLRARRRPSRRRRTPSCKFVTRPASAARASSVIPLTTPRAPLARDLGHLKHSILSRRDLSSGP